MKRLVCLLLALVCGRAALVAARPQTQVFRSGIKTVPIYATVQDKSGRLIPGLAKEEFQIYDNLKPVDTTLFVNDITPVSVVVMLDTSGSMTMSYDLLKDAAEQFVIRLLPADRARIGSFSDAPRIKLSPTFTGNRDELIRILHNDIDFGNATALWDAVDVSMTALSGLDGRRVVLIFTDGDDNDSRRSLNDCIKRAQSEDFMIYAIGLRSHVGREITNPDKGLQKIAAETGGGYFLLQTTADLNSTFTRVAQELHSQYVIGFSPATLDGKLHTIDVKMKDTSLTVRGRKSYVATADK
jgi:Ca-activated chloride channel family protein